MIDVQWQYFPRSKEIPNHLKKVVEVFNMEHPQINSYEHNKHSDDVLKIISSSLEEIGYVVEKGKKREEKIHVPVLFGKNGKLEKYFDADGYNEVKKTVVEIEAGRGVTNYQFLKDLFQACMMSNVEYLVIAVRNVYKTSKDFEKVTTFFDTLYASGRLELPLKGILIIGY